MIDNWEDADYHVWSLWLLGMWTGSHNPALLPRRASVAWCPIDAEHDKDMANRGEIIGNAFMASGHVVYKASYITEHLVRE